MPRITAREIAQATVFAVLGILVGTTASRPAPPAPDGRVPADRPGTGIYQPYHRPTLTWPPRAAPSAAPAALLHSGVE